MKLVIREYLASLRERGELDAILPDLLSEMGFTVYSRPARGTRQYGVDIAAVGQDSDGEQKLFLFLIKQGDLTRSDWDGTPQTLRPSINDIFDVYLTSHVPEEHKGLKVVIVLCFGGDVHESIRETVSAFTKKMSTPRLRFEEWNGDRLAGLLLDGLLREQLLPKELRSHFQKAVAMVDEPDVSYGHFASLVQALVEGCGPSDRERITTVRQIYVCLWIHFVWARDVGNVESPYRASELAILNSWHLVRAIVAEEGRAATVVGLTISEMVRLHFLVWDELVGRKILPHVEHRHAISNAVRSASPVDVNLKLFDLLGRMAMRGLWLLWSDGGDDLLPEGRREWSDPEIDALSLKIVEFIRNNPALLTPITDEQSIEIALAVLFLSSQQRWHPTVQNWLEALAEGNVFAFRSHGRYPSIHRAYRDLLYHPRERTDEYREEATGGSTLMPLLALWSAALGATEIMQLLATFKEEDLQHCNCQLWFPDEDSEEHFYRGLDRHGAVLSDVPITRNPEEMLDYVGREVDVDQHFAALSAIQLGHWPLIAMACRHYRLPIPASLWMPVLRGAYRNTVKRQDAADRAA